MSVAVVSPFLKRSIHVISILHTMFHISSPLFLTEAQEGRWWKPLHDPRSVGLYFGVIVYRATLYTNTHPLPHTTHHPPNEVETRQSKGKGSRKEDSRHTQPASIHPSPSCDDRFFRLELCRTSPT